MKLIEHGDRCYVAGLDWEAKAFPPSKAEVRQDARTHKATHVVEHQGVGDQSEGTSYSYGFGSLPKLPRMNRKPVVSLAAAVASQGTDAFMFVMPMDTDSPHGEAAFVGVLSGHPAPGCDLIGTEHEISEAVRRFADTNGVLQVFFDPECGRPEFLDGFQFKPLKIAAAEYVEELRPVGGTPVLAVVGVVAVLGVGGMVGAGMYAKWSEEQELARLRASRIDPNLVYQQSRDAAFAQFSPIPVTAARQVLESLLRLPVVSGGWEATKIGCLHIQGSAPPAFACTVTWTNNAGTFKTFAGVPGDASIEYGDDLSTVTTRWQVPVSNVRPLEPALFAELPPSGQWKVEVGSLLQDMGQVPSFKLGTTAPVLVGATADPAVTNRLMRGTWTLQGHADLAAELIGALPGTMTLEGIEITTPAASAEVKGDALPMLNINGGFYVRQTR